MNGTVGFAVAAPADEDMTAGEAAAVLMQNLLGCGRDC